MPAFMLIVWPAVTLALFAALGPLRGLIWATIAGYLLLPSGYGFDLPGLGWNKSSAISFSILFAALVFRHRLPARTLRTRNETLTKILIVFAVLLVVGAFFTFWGNRAPVTVGGTVRSGLGARDFASMIINPAIAFIPFILALIWLDRPEEHRMLVAALTAAGVFYGLLVLFEWRMSPQLNSWVYGYFPDDWKQHRRGGGFRPVVFLNHGLAIGLFLFAALMAAIGGGVGRRDGPERAAFLFAAAWIFLALVLSRNLGAYLITLPLVAVFLFFGRRGALWTAAGLSAAFLILPALRQAGLLPLDQILSLAAWIDADRAASLAFRIDNENTILTRALEKPLFGWGGWGRWRGEETGAERTVADGFWVIQLGRTGWAGYLGYFGPLVLPLLALPFLARARGADAATTALALIAAGNFVYIIPNAVFTPISFLCIGALAGLVLHRYGESEAEAPEPLPSRRPTGYTRFPEGVPAARSRPLRDRPASGLRRRG